MSRHYYLILPQALVVLGSLMFATPAFAGTLSFSPGIYTPHGEFTLSGDDALYLGYYYIGDTEIATPCYIFEPGQRIAATMYGEQSVPGTYVDLMASVGYDDITEGCEVPEGSQFALFSSNDAFTSCINTGDDYDTCLASESYVGVTTFEWGSAVPTP
jgi:hypothetical protein